MFVSIWAARACRLLGAYWRLALRLWVKALLRRARSRASRDAFGEQTSPGADGALE